MTGIGASENAALATVFAAVVCCGSAIEGLDNGLGLRPPQGWRSWNVYHTAITQGIILEAAQVLAATRSLPAASGGGPSSFKALGFDHVGIDEGWAKCHAGVNGSFHRLDGSPIVDTAKFPSLKQLTDDIHKLGMKAGWYTRAVHGAVAAGDDGAVAAGDDAAPAAATDAGGPRCTTAHRSVAACRPPRHRLLRPDVCDGAAEVSEPCWVCGGRTRWRPVCVRPDPSCVRRRSLELQTFAWVSY